MLALIAAALVAAPGTYDLKDPKGVNGLTLAIESPLEPVRGSAFGVSGNIAFDPARVEKTSARVVVASDSVTLGGAAMTAAMQGSWCLDVKKHPTIEFALERVENLKQVEENRWTADAVGTFTFHGVSKPLTATVDLRSLPGKLKERGGMEKDGDLVAIRTRFSFDRFDFGVAEDLSENLIGRKIEVDLALVGSCPR